MASILRLRSADNMSFLTYIRRLNEVRSSKGNREALDGALVFLKVYVVKKLHHLRRRVMTDWEFLQFRLWKESRLHGYQTIADPFKTIWVSPDNIQYLSSPARPDQYAVGQINSGDWDREGKRFNETYICKCFTERFVHGMDWAETEFVQECLTGNRTWRGAETPEEIRERCEMMDHLYIQISQQGFVSRQELTNEDPKSAIKSGGRITVYLDNVLVDIGRDGQFFFVDGKHRLAIAKILGIDSIPVNIIVRHKQWQTVREEIARANDPNELSKQARHHLNHPDLKELVPDKLR